MSRVKHPKLRLKPTCYDFTNMLVRATHPAGCAAARLPGCPGRLTLAPFICFTKTQQTPSTSVSIFQTPPKLIKTIQNPNCAAPRLVPRERYFLGKKTYIDTLESANKDNSIISAEHRPPCQLSLFREEGGVLQWWPF